MVVRMVMFVELTNTVSTTVGQVVDWLENEIFMVIDRLPPEADKIVVRIDESEEVA